MILRGFLKIPSDKMNNLSKEEKIALALQELAKGNYDPFDELTSTSWLHDGSMRGKSFRNLNLDVLLLRGDLDLVGCDFSGATFYENNILNSDLADSSFNSAIIEKAYFMDCFFEGASFANARISYTRFRAEMRDTVWDNASLVGVVYGGQMRGASFSGASLDGAVFGHIDLRGVNFTGAIFKGVQFVQVTFDTTTTLPDGSKWKPGAIHISNEWPETGNSL